MAVLKKCAGLITHPNELLKREGALEVAQNIIIDADDTIEVRNGFNDFGTSFGNANDVAKQIFSYKGRILRHYDTTLQYDSNGLGSFQSFSGAFNELQDGLRLKGLETKGNFYFTTNDGIKKISALTASNFSTASGYIENAGVPKAVDVKASLVFQTGGFLPPQSKCAYRVVWGKKDTNNNLLLGAPTGREILENNSDRTVTPEEFVIDMTGVQETDVAGNYILFSSLNTDYFLWFSNAANPDEPQSAETISRTPIEVDVDGLGVADSNIAAVTANAIGSIGSEFSIELATTTITVTSTEEGDVTNASAQSGGITNVTVSVSTEGQVSEGTSANGELSITVPSDVNSTDYFYQVYRTAPATATEGIDLVDIDPGDEMNLVLESNITSSEIIAGEVIVEDITTEDFRINGAFLYTNPNTGEGILQANERPPIATDIALFRNSTFYANTKSLHRLTVNLLSVSDFTSGTSNLVIGNSTVTREYTFIGVTEVYDITTDTYANTTANSILLLNSARDERKYYIWFDKGGGTDPLVANRTSVRIDISDATTAADVSLILANTLDLLDDFNVSDNGGSVTVTLAKNGDTTDPAFGTTPPGGAWAFNVTTQGEGEDTANQEILLSSIVSVAQAIDETARSIVRVINRDPSSPVNAYYLSGPDSLPGIISLESRSLEDDPFYLATSDTNITAKFDPTLPETETISAISADNPTQITSAGHGLSTGNSVYIYGTDSTPALLGQYTVTVLDANTFTVPVQVFSVGSTGIWFKTDVESDNEEKPNRLYYSKTSQPEAVPLVNYLDIGAQDKEIKRILPLRDSLFVLKDDGVFIITGTTAPNFSSRLLDGTVKLTAPDSAVVLNNQIYALTSEGVSTITESGVSIISRSIENRIFEFVNSRTNYKTVCFGVAYDSDKSYILWCPMETTDTVATQAYRYNTVTDTWTRWTIAATCGLVEDDIDKLYIGDATRNYVLEERKNGDRTDKSDRNFSISLPSNSTSGTNITLSSIANVAIGDVVYQTQYVTAAQINRLLLKLDIDLGLDDNDYYSTLAITQGANLQNSLNAINAKLVADDDSGSITSRSFSSDFETIQTEYNDMIAELNLIASDTVYKDYAQSSNTVPYEGIITAKALSGNVVTLDQTYPWLEGPIDIYKGIDVQVQWAPQDFGAADVLKQVREGTILFDQNNFYSATVGYASDLSQNFSKVPFLGRGVGYWGAGTWGNTIWGGLGNEVPIRTLIPREKQRCRFIKVKFTHINARENVRIIGISLEPRALSKRAYR